jgi:hypothetical protein
MPLYGGSGRSVCPCPLNDTWVATHVDSTLITALATMMLADPGGLVTRG